MGVDPCRGQGDHKKIAGVFTLRPGVPARAARLRTLAKRSLRAVDQLDYLVRHWLTPVPIEKGVRSLPHKDAWIPRSGLPTDIHAIGRRLRAEYTLERSMPARLSTLLREFQRRTKEAEAIGGGGYTSAA
jgi:hypothetical protein